MTRLEDAARGLFERSEHDLQSTAIEALRRGGWLVIRLNAGALRNARGIPIKFVSLGRSDLTVPDALAITPEGVTVWLEFKRPTGRSRVRPAQQAFITEVRRRGQRAYFVSDFGLIQALLSGVWPPYAKT